jgi:hypothetical protein
MGGEPVFRGDGFLLMPGDATTGWREGTGVAMNGARAGSLGRKRLAVTAWDVAEARLGGRGPRYSGGICGDREMGPRPTFLPRLPALAPHPKGPPDAQGGAG